MSDVLTQFDAWLDGQQGPAALVIREHLMPVEGEKGVLFPPTFAAGDGFAGGYNIDHIGDPKEGKNICLVDSVGSQANRMEPIFDEPGYEGLVPDVRVQAGDKSVSILEAGHRAGDALFRCSALQESLELAFKAVLQGDAEPLGKLAPTSLVFGVWDSRETQAKLPRLVTSTVRAFDVQKLTRGAVYIPPVDYSALDVFSDAEKAKAEGSSKSPLAQRGFVHNPASGSHGGVIAAGGVRRDATLSLAALQQIKTNTPEGTVALRRYILGLSLVAFTANTAAYLRQGCNLVLNPEKPRECVTVLRDGSRPELTLTHAEAIAFAKAAAEAFGVGDDQTVLFEKAKAKADVKKKD